MAAGYQYDNLLEHQFSTGLGVSITPYNSKSVNRLKPIKRNLILYGYRPEFANYTVINAYDNINNIINKAPRGTTFIIKENQKLTDTLALKEGQNLYNKYNYSPLVKKSDTPQKVKLEFAENTPKPMIELAEGVHIKGLYLDGSNIEGDYGVINNTNNIRIEQCIINNAPYLGISAGSTPNSIFQYNIIDSSYRGIQFNTALNNLIVTA